MPFANTAPLRREIEARIPERPFTVEFWDGTRLPSTAGDGPTFSVRSPRAAAHVLRAPGPARPRPRLRQRRDRGRRHGRGDRAARRLAAAVARRRRQAGAAARRGARRRADAAAAAGPPPSCARAAAATARSATPAPSATTTTSPTSSSSSSSTDSMVYSCAIFSRGREDAGGGPGGEARDGRPQAGAEGGRPGARRRLRLGRLPALGGDQARRQRRRHHPLRRRRPRRRGSGPRRPASPTGSRSGSWTTATSPASASTRSPASAWSSTSAPPRSTSTRSTLAGLLEPGGRLLNHGITRLRHTDAEAGAFSERYVFPDAAPLHLSRNLLALERAGFVTHHVEELRRRLRRDPAPLGRSTSTRTSTRRSASPAPNGSASGASTCAPRATASSHGFTSIYQARCTPGLSDLAGQASAAACRHQHDVDCSSDREAGLDRLDRPVGAGLAQLLDRVAAGGDADDPDAGAVAGVDVAGGVADGDRRRRVERCRRRRARRRARAAFWSARCGRASRSRSRRRRRSG